ncbi:MAG: sensor histidine kinase [Chloroflexota bacterium]
MKARPAALGGPTIVALPIRTWLLVVVIALVVLPQLATGAALIVEQWLTTFSAQAELARDVEQNVARWNDPVWQRSIEGRLTASHLNMALQDGSGQFVFLTAPIPVPGFKLVGAAPASSERPSPSQVAASAAVDTLYLSQPWSAMKGMVPNVEIGAVRAAVAGPALNVIVEKPVMLSMTSTAVRDGQGRINRVYFWGPEDPIMARIRDLLLPVFWLLALLVTVVVAAWFAGRAILRPLAAMSVAARQIAAGDLNFDLPDSRVSEVAEVGTAFRAMGAALEASIGQQARLEQERRMFINAIVHDLRTPLFSLRGYLEGLAEGVANSTEKTEKYVQICREKADALDRLVSDLFAYAQIEYLEQAPGREPLDLGALLQRLVDGFQPLASGMAIVMSTRGDSSGCWIAGDAHLLTRAVENLLDNALRHTPTGGWIEVSWRHEKERLAFSVVDSGPGFDPRDLPRVFTPLYRADTSRNRQTGGAGLGLTIARQILRAHGGDLVAGNAPAGGAALSGYLPMAAERTSSPASVAIDRSAW